MCGAVRGTPAAGRGPVPAVSVTRVEPETARTEPVAGQERPGFGLGPPPARGAVEAIPPGPGRTRSTVVAVAVAIALAAGALIGVAVMILTRSEPPEAVPVVAADDREDARNSSAVRRSDRGTTTTATTEAAPVVIQPNRPATTVPPPVTIATPTQRLSPTSAHASCQSPNGEDAAGNQMTYPPARAIDGDPSTVWRCDGDGVNHWIELRFAQAIEVTEIGIVVGFDKIDPVDGSDRFPQSRRVSTIRVELDDGTMSSFGLADDRSMQFVNLSGTTRTVRVVITASRPGSTIYNNEGHQLPATDKTPIAELTVNGRPT